MQVDRHDPVNPGALDQVGHQLGRDRRARAGPAVLPCIAEVGHYRRDAPRHRPLQGVDQDQQLHQVVVGRERGRLQHVHVFAAHVLLHLDEDFHVGEALDHALGQRKFQRASNRLGQRAIAVAGNELHARRPLAAVRISRIEGHRQQYSVHTWRVLASGTSACKFWTEGTSRGKCQNRRPGGAAAAAAQFTALFGGRSLAMPWTAAPAAWSAVLPQAPSKEPSGMSFFWATVPSFLPCGSLTTHSIWIACLPSRASPERYGAFDPIGRGRGPWQASRPCPATRAGWQR